MPVNASVRRDPAGPWRERWRNFWSYLPLTRATRIVLLVVAAATLVVDGIRAVLSGSVPSGAASALVTLLVAGFAWRPVWAAGLLAVGMVAAIPLGAGDVWLVGMAIAAGIVAATCSTPLAVTYVAWMLVGIVIGESARADERPIGNVIVLLVVAATSILGGAFFREARRRQEAKIRALEAAAEAGRRALRDERQRIADELHDFIAHELTIIVMHARVLERTDDPASRATAQAAITSAATQALADVRRVLDVSQALKSTDSLAVPVADDAVDQRHSLVHALADVRRELTGMGAEVHVETDAAVLDDLSRSIDAGLAHIVREATTNIVKHGGGARRVDIALVREAGRLRLSVANDLDPNRDGLRVPVGGYGLARMRERATLSGGTLTASAVDGRWVVEVSLPLR